MESFLGLPDIGSAHGMSLDIATWWVHLLMLVLGIGWTTYFVYVLYRFSAKRNPTANYDGVKSHTSTWVEGSVVVAEAVLLLGFSFPLWAARVDDFPKPEEATVVRAVGEQFAWNFHYPGPDGVFGRTDIDLIDLQSNPLGLDNKDPAAKDDITTVNQIHLPAGKPAIIEISSKDVIHSFSLNEMRSKQDAIPGMSIPMWFTPTVTTAEMREHKDQPDYNYEIACAQLCGLGHYRMRGFLTVDTPEEYAAWLEEQAPSEDEGESFWE